MNLDELKKEIDALSPEDKEKLFSTEKKEEIKEDKIEVKREEVEDKKEEVQEEKQEVHIEDLKKQIEDNKKIIETQQQTEKQKLIDEILEQQKYIKDNLMKNISKEEVQTEKKETPEELLKIVDDEYERQINQEEGGD